MKKQSLLFWVGWKITCRCKYSFVLEEKDKAKIEQGTIPPVPLGVGFLEGKKFLSIRCSKCNWEIIFWDCPL